MVAVVPPHRDLDTDAVPFAFHVDRLRHDGLLRAVEVFDEFTYPALVVQFDMQRFGRAVVFEDDPHAGVQEGQFAQALFQRVEIVVEVGEGARGREEAHLCALLALGIADDAQVFRGLAVFELGVVLLAVAPDAQLEPDGERIHHRHAHAVQTAGDLVGILVELTAGVQLGHDDLGGRDPLFGVDVGGNTTSVVTH